MEQPAVERVRAMRREQGLPEHLEDPTQIRRLASLLVTPLTSSPKETARRRAA